MRIQSRWTWRTRAGWRIARARRSHSGLSIDERPSPSRRARRVPRTTDRCARDTSSSASIDGRASPSSPSRACRRGRPVVAAQPVRVPVQPALLGRGAAPAHHAARGCARCSRRSRASGSSRSGRAPATTRCRSRAGSRRAGRSSSSTSSARCSTTRSAAAAEQGIDGIVATLADATEMPYEDASMRRRLPRHRARRDPRPGAPRCASSHRVVRPGGRVVVGELFGDPHWVSPARLRERAERAGLRFERRSGSPLGYFARLARD